MPLEHLQPGRRREHTHALITPTREPPLHLSLSLSLLLHWIFQEPVVGMAAQYTMTGRGINKVLIERNDVILILRPLNLRHVGAAVTFTGMNGAFGGAEGGGWRWCIIWERYFLPLGGSGNKWRKGFFCEAKKKKSLETRRFLSCPSQEHKEDIRGGRLRYSGAGGPFSSLFLLTDATRLEVNGCESHSHLSMQPKKAKKKKKSEVINRLIK